MSYFGFGLFSKENKAGSVEEKFHVHLFHDVENCLCVGKIDAKKLVNETLSATVKAAFKVDSINVNTDLIVDWKLCQSWTKTDSKYSSKAVITEMAQQPGVTVVYNGKEKMGARDVELKNHIDGFCRQYHAYKPEVQDKTVAVVISSDSDFNNDVQKMLALGIRVVIIYNNSNTNRTYREVVESEFSLPIWENLLASCTRDSRPAVALKKQDKAPVEKKVTLQTTFVIDIAHAAAVYRLVDAMYGECYGGKMPSGMGCCKLDDGPALTRVLTLLNFSEEEFSKVCDKSQGAVVVETVYGLKSLSICLWALLRFFVLNAGGKITAAQVGEFYKAFTNHGTKIKAHIANFPSKIRSLCESSEGKMIYEATEDKKAGFGIVMADTYSTSLVPTIKTEIKKEIEVQNVSPPPPPVESREILFPIGYQKFNHLKWLSKGIVDDKLLQITPCVVMELVITGSLVKLKLVKYEGNTSEMQLLEECKNCVLGYLQLLVTSDKYENYHVAKADLHRDVKLNSIRTSKLVYVVTMKQYANSVLMEIPASWQSQTNPKPNSPQKKKNDNVKYGDMVYQHLLSKFEIAKNHYSCEIVDKPVLHAKLTFVENNPVTLGWKKQFSDYLSEYTTFQLISPPDISVTSVIDRIKEIEFIRPGDEMLDVFRNHHYHNKSYYEPCNDWRPYDEQYFFQIGWNFFLSEVMNTISTLNSDSITVVYNDRKPVIQFNRTAVRREHYKILFSYFIKQSKRLVIGEVKIPAKADADLNKALKDALKKVKLRFKKQVKSAKDQSGIDPTDSEDTAESRFKFPEAKPFYSSRGVYVVGIRENQELFDILMAEAKQFVKTFKVKDVPIVSGFNQNGLNLKKFDLHSFKYDKDTKVMRLKGVSLAVESAVCYIEQVSEGKKPTSVAVKATDLGVIHAELLWRYLRLDALKKLQRSATDADPAKSIVAQIQDMVKSSFPKVTSTLAAQDDENADDMIILVLHGPEGSIEGARNIAMDQLRGVALGLSRRVLDDWQEWEVDFLMQHATSIGSKHDSVVDFVTPTAAVNELIVDEHTKCKFALGNINISVACCNFRDTGALYGCDSVLNSANSKLSNVGGIAKVMSEIGGAEFDKECRERNDVPVGSAVTTQPHLLRDCGFQHIVHVVAPSVLGDAADVDPAKRMQMRQAICSGLTECCVNGSNGVAIPGIGMGIFRWPLEAAAREIVLAICHWIGINAGSSHCTLKNITLFDIDPNVADCFIETVKQLVNGALVKADLSSVVSPGLGPLAPSHMWYWNVWDFEISRGDFEAGTVKIIIIDGAQYNVIPYDYDQLVQIEQAYNTEGRTTFDIIGDLNGRGNGKKYVLDFAACTQTTQPMFNKYSCRRIFRVAVESVDNIPLFRERVLDHQTAVDSYTSQLNQKNLLTPDVIPTCVNFGPFYSESGHWCTCGVSIYGQIDVADAIADALRQCIIDNTVHENVKLELLKSSHLTFQQAYAEIIRTVKLHGEITVKDEANWEVCVQGLGDVAVLKGVNQVLSWERQNLSIPLPSSWKCDAAMANSDDNILEEIFEGDEDYDVAYACVLERGFTVKTIKIERVKNVELYREYQKKKSVVARLNNGDANEILLKHGTRSAEPRVVWDSGSKTNSYGFDLRYSSEQNYFGRGAYFTDDGAYAHNWAYKVPGTDGQERKFFLALVARGAVEMKYQIEKTIKTPSPGFQSVQGPITPSNQGTVVYELNQSYPAFLITYTQ